MIRHNFLDRFIKDESAGTMVLTAVVLPAILGFAGMGLDATGWYMQKRQLQNLTDMAALEAVHSGEWFAADALNSQVSSFIDTRGGNSDTDTVTLTTPPTSGAYVGRAGFMELTVERDVELYFVDAMYGMMGQDFAVTVAARAVAGTLVVGTQCVVALDDSADRALNFQGNTEVGTECGITSNSTSDEAIYVGGSAELTTVSAQAVGDISVSGSGSLISDTPPQSLSSPADNPYESLTIPPIGACDVIGATTLRDDDVLFPGRYCGDITVQGDNVVFEPGTYVIEGGDFGANANSTFSGDGVTFILTGTSPADVGGISMNGSTSADLSAPTSGAYQGILFYQDPIAEYRSNGSDATFAGGADLLMDGVLYFPSSDITFTGGTSADPSCMQVWGATVTFAGDSKIGNDDAICLSLGLDVSPQIRILLVE